METRSVRRGGPVASLMSMSATSRPLAVGLVTGQRPVGPHHRRRRRRPGAREVHRREEGRVLDEGRRQESQENEAKKHPSELQVGARADASCKHDPVQADTDAQHEVAADSHHLLTPRQEPRSDRRSGRPNARGRWKGAAAPPARECRDPPPRRDAPRGSRDRRDSWRA